MCLGLWPLPGQGLGPPVRRRRGGAELTLGTSQGPALVISRVHVGRAGRQWPKSQTFQKLVCLGVALLAGHLYLAFAAVSRGDVVSEHVCSHSSIAPSWRLSRPTSGSRWSRRARCSRRNRRASGGESPPTAAAQGSCRNPWGLCCYRYRHLKTLAATQGLI